jgi:hypothetical protein
MKRLPLGFVVLFILILLSLGLIRAEAQSGDVLTGERIWFSKRPTWAFSGVWGPDNTLLLVDVLRNDVKVYSVDGAFQGTVAKQFRDEKFSKPMIIQAAPGLPGQFWLEDEDGRFVLLDGRYRIRKVVDLGELAKGPQGELRAVYQWVPTDSEFFIFGDISKGDAGTSAFLRVPIDRPQQFQIIDQVGLEDPGRRFYLLGMPFLAAAQGSPYYLFMGRQPYLTSPGWKRMSFTLGKGRPIIERPQLPEERGRLAARAIFGALEESTGLPSGLFGWKGSLYVLMRTQAAWYLLKVDPKSGRSLWHWRIDSTAKHLTVIPGEEYWAFVEKGRVEEAGLQEIPSFLRVPAKSLDR